MKNFREWYQSLDRRSRQRLATRAGLAMMYIEKKLIYGRNMLLPSNIRALAKATRGAFTEGELAVWCINAKIERDASERRRLKRLRR